MIRRVFPDIAAVILAAGFSSRMGRFKPLLPLGETSALGHIAAAYRRAGVTKLLAVSGHAAEELEAEAAALGIPVARNPRYAEGMFSSACAGLAAVSGARRIFVHPVDIPLVRPDTLSYLAFRAEELDCAAALPGFLGEPGHPPLIDAALVPEILAWTGGGGLKGALARHSPCRIPVADRHILFDMDTPEAYAEALRRQARAYIPTPEEAVEMLRLYGHTPERGIAHARGVAKVALALCDALNACGYSLDRELVETAALLHDIAKGLPRHEETGGALLADLGFARIAEIVAAHLDMHLPDGAPLTEKELVYLADKLVRGPYRIGLEDRFAEKIAQWKDDPAASAAIRGRLDNARAMLTRFEAELDRPLEDILRSLDLPWDRRRA